MVAIASVCGFKTSAFFEQENRELKVMGGIVGITQKEQSLDKYFLIAPELSKIQQQFEEMYGNVSNEKRTEHHEITGGKLTRVSENAVKLARVFHEHGDPFHSVGEHELVNLLNQSVMTDAVTNDILQRDVIGQEMFLEFVYQRLTEGNISVWGKMTKRKLKTFKSECPTAKIKVGNNIIKIKEERSLLQRFIVISRSRPDLDLKECIGEYEFGVVPRSLFSADGCLLLPYDKSSMLHHLENMNEIQQNSEQDMSRATDSISPPNINTSVIDMDVESVVAVPDLDKIQQDPESTSKKVLIVDGMALVNSVTKTDE